MVPNSWEKVSLGEVFDFRNGINADKSQYGQGVKFVNVMDVFGNDVLTEPKIIGRISISEKKLDDNRLEYGDVLFNRTSETFDEIAMSAVYLDSADATFGGFVIRGRPLTNSLDPKYTVYAFQDSNFRKQVIQLGQGAVRANIGQKDLVKVELLVPPLPEQQKIAKILSTCDKAISTTERLIENSTHQKKALMQQLLTGKKRLLDESGKRFEGEWEEVTLEEAVKYRRGSFPQPYGNPEWVDEVNGYPFVQVYDIAKNMKLKPDTKMKISDAAIDKSVFIPKETIIVSLQGSIGRVAITQYDAYVDRTILLFQEFLVPMNKMFFAYIIQELFEIEKTKAPGGTIKTITKAVLSNFKVLIPSLKEQQKIATVLTNADKEIELLEQQLADLQQEKKALMQVLLTGKKRVRINDRT